MQVLTDQVEAQNARIRELEVRLSEMNAQLLVNERRAEQLESECGQAEQQKQRLCNELDRFRTLKEDRIQMLQSEVALLQRTLLDRDSEVAQLRLKLARIARLNPTCERINQTFEMHEINQMQSASSESINEKVYFKMT